MDLIITDLQQGTGKEAVKGKEITVHYTGMLEDAFGLWQSWRRWGYSA